MTALAETMPRPGLALGLYPERAAERPGWADALADRLASRWAWRPAALARVVTEIDAAGESLAKMPEEVLSMSASGLRLRLARDGWNRDLAVQAFAMVRETSRRVLGMRHFPSQLIGGWVLFNGKLAEMATGEGKTLTATLPACTAAMAGVPVHVVTANDYLAARDAELMRPVYEALGVSVGVVLEEMDFDARRAAYACDVTYCTNKQVAFDYLRDRVERGSAASRLQLDLERLYDDPSQRSRLMLRGLCFAIVDEADSVLVDEARTPLILSRAADGGEAQPCYREALALAARLAADEDYRLLAREREVRLTERGRERVAELAEPLGGVWTWRRRREELVSQALAAEHLFIRDRQYVVREGKVQIVDDSTGRVMADRSWERGLHQMVEAKEGCELSDQKETLARISYQRFFRRYLKLAGMTGTGREVARELGEVYGLSAVEIPTHRPSRRVARPERIYARIEDKLTAISRAVAEESARGRPVLVGTRSVLMSERIGEMLEAAGLRAQILNARQDSEEARVVAEAGEPGRVTVATNMAGRGTDIHLADGVDERGGLHVIVTARNEAARIDRQLIGRCARQGDAGSYQMFACLEDEIPTRFYPAPLRRALALLAWYPEGRMPTWLGRLLLDLAQAAMERRHERMRRQLEREDERLADVLAFTGRLE